MTKAPETASLGTPPSRHSLWKETGNKGRQDMRTFKASCKNHIFKGQLWRFGQTRAVLVSQLAAEYFIRPHPGAGRPPASAPCIIHGALRPHQSILDLGPLQEPMSGGFLEPQGGPGGWSPLSQSASALGPAVGSCL